MTNTRALRWGAILLLGIGAGVVLGQAIAPTPEAMLVRVVSPPEIDPWFVRYASLVLLVGGGILSLYVKAKILDPMRAEFHAEVAAIRADLRAEGAERREALLRLEASFEKTLGRVEGVVTGLDGSVKILTQTMTSISTAATGMSRIAAKLETSQAVAVTKTEALEQRVGHVEDTSHGFQETKR